MVTSQSTGPSLLPSGGAGVNTAETANDALACPNDEAAADAVPTISCPVCGQIDAKAEQDWIQDERQRLEAYTHGQLEMVRLQRQDFLKHRSEVEAALAIRGQELNRQMRQFAAQVNKIPQREKELGPREQELLHREQELAWHVQEHEQRVTMLGTERQRLAVTEQDLATQQAALTLREQAAAEREAETERREVELATQQERLLRTEEAVTKLQAEQEALRLRGEVLQSEQVQIEEAIKAARKQLASLEEEYARRAASLVQREEAPARREPVAYVQEPVAPRPPVAPPASGSAGGTSRSAPVSSPAPDSTRQPVEQPVAVTAAPVVPTRQPVAPAASGSGTGVAPKAVPASGSNPGQLRQPSSPPASGSGAGVRPEDLRTAPRRRGNPVSVQITNDLRNAESWPGWVVDRSPDGLCLLADEAAEIGTMLNVRPTKAGPSARWIQVVVRSCSSERSSWKLGCQFQNKLTWDDLQYFG